MRTPPLPSPTLCRALLLTVTFLTAAAAQRAIQQPYPPVDATPPSSGPVRPQLQDRPSTPVTSGWLTLPAGTDLEAALNQPLNGKYAYDGDQIHLVTTVPIAADNRIVIPLGSFVLARVRDVQHAGHLHRGGSLRLELISVMLPNGYTLPLTGQVDGAPDGADAHVGAREGQLKADSDTGQRVRDGVVAGAGTGATLGTLIGASRGGVGGAVRGLGAGAGIGAAAGVAGEGIGMLFSKGRDVRLPTGAQLSLTIQHDVRVPLAALDFTVVPPPPVEPPALRQAPAAPAPTRPQQRFPVGFPFPI